MAVTLDLHKLKMLTRKLEDAIAREGEYRSHPEFPARTADRREICTQCYETCLYGCQCDNDD